MRYYTKEYYGKASISSVIPNCLTVISEDEYDFDTLMQRRVDQYARIDASRMIMEDEREEMEAMIKKRKEESEEFGFFQLMEICREKYADKEAFQNKIKEYIRTPEFALRQKNGESIGIKSYESQLKHLNSFLDEDTKKKIRDIRILALHFVTKQENDIMQAWRKAFKAESKRMIDEYDTYYQAIEPQLTASVKRFMECDFFDLKCERMEFIQDDFLLSYWEDDTFTFLFHHAQNVAIEGQLDFLMAREVFVNDDASYHLNLLFEKGEISLDCGDITITDTRVWSNPDIDSITMGGCKDGSPPKAFRSTVFGNACEPSNPF